jgi:hypothetical protein
MAMTKMMNKINWELCGAITALCVCVYMLFTIPMPSHRVYDCRIAEISPDFPLKAKEECRKQYANSRWHPITPAQASEEK